MLRYMNDNKRKATETLGQAALRLLQRLERKKAVPAYSGTRIHDSPKECPPSLGEEEGRESAYREAALHPGPVTAYPAGGVTGGGLGVVAKSDGRISTRVVSRFINCNDNRPSNREDVAAERTREVYTLPAVVR
jgi:hypothetical protein